MTLRNGRGIWTHALEGGKCDDARTKAAREKIGLLCEHIIVAPATATVVQKAAANRKINDFEDGLEYYSATESKCGIIVTEDVDDFYFSEIPVLTARNFFENHVAG